MKSEKFYTELAEMMLSDVDCDTELEHVIGAREFFTKKLAKCFEEIDEHGGGTSQLLQSFLNLSLGNSMRVRSLQNQVTQKSTKF